MSDARDFTAMTPGERYCDGILVRAGGLRNWVSHLQYAPEAGP